MGLYASRGGGGYGAMAVEPNGCNALGASSLLLPTTGRVHAGAAYGFANGIAPDTFEEKYHENLGSLTWPAAARTETER